jgi:hypothetical protein
VVVPPAHRVLYQNTVRGRRKRVTCCEIKRLGSKEEVVVEEYWISGDALLQRGGNVVRAERNSSNVLKEPTTTNELIHKVVHHGR